MAPRMSATIAIAAPNVPYRARYATTSSHSWQRTSSRALSSMLGSSISGTITTFEPSQVEHAISTSVECMPLTGSGSLVFRKILSFSMFPIAPFDPVTESSNFYV